MLDYRSVTKTGPIFRRMAQGTEQLDDLHNAQQGSMHHGIPQRIFTNLF